MKTKWETWHNHVNQTPKEFICGFCGYKVGSHVGYYNGTDSLNQALYICTNCGLPSLFFNDGQYPGPILGRNITNLPTDVEQIYKEIRDSIKNSSYTAAILLGRKLIMHLAVDIAKAEEGLSFAQYVEHLKDSNYIPPNGGAMLKYIKDLGNEKNHEIKIGTESESQKVLKFIEGLLIFIYEFPAEFTDPA
jgi:hypothetical protein